MTPNTQSVCKYCQRPRSEHDLSSLFCRTKTVYQFEPVSEPASTGEPLDKVEWTMPIAGEPSEVPPLKLARPSEPSAPQTDVPYLKRCAAEGWDCGCVDVCKFAAAPQPVSGDAPKVEEIARQIAAIGSETAWLSKGPRSKEWFIEQTALYLSLALRRYFPPASQTPPRCKHCDGLENGFLHRNGPVSTNYHDFEPATPASTVRKSPDSHLGAVRD